MRLLLNELKKLLNPRLAAILLLFSIAYTFLFLNFRLTQGTSERNIRLYGELRSEFGAELSLDEWDAFSAKRDGVLERINEQIRASEIMRKNGIEDYEAFIHTPPIVFTPDMSEADMEFEQERSRIYHDRASQLIGNLLEMDILILAKENHWVLADESEYDEARAENGRIPNDTPYKNDAVAERYRRTSTRGVSLMPAAVLRALDEDLLWLFILAAILCFVLILPRLIGEHLRGMREIQLASKTGRGIFPLQAGTCAVFGLCVGMLLIAVYGAILWRCGALRFIACDINTYDTRLRFWTDMSFGGYLLIHAAAVLLFSVCASLFAYFIGRLSGNYITGLALALPVAAALVWGFLMLCQSPLNLFGAPTLAAAVIKSCGALLILAVIVIAVLIMLKRDKARDIL
ncbi:MAG: hypothetical protein IKZ82_13955 [Clostridia bacterium]|nr:hypothetical protein [Clostridia bacterium]